MNSKIKIALKNLNKILPLKESQDKCSPEIKNLHKIILNSFIESGHILSKVEMSEYVRDIDEAIKILSEKDMVVFSESGMPVGAYPFTMEDREHKIKINGFELNAMCALDALAISQMYNMPTKISSLCRITQAPIYLEQLGASILNSGALNELCVGVAWGAIDKDLSCADSLCTEMIFIKDKETARGWKKSDAEKREIFTLDEAMEFAGRFFVPLVS
ncbi:MAG: organomercurial lyase [Woeseiaceae bacterium]